MQILLNILIIIYELIRISQTILEEKSKKMKQFWLISNLMHKILIYLYIIHLLKSSTCFEHYPAHLQEVYVVIVYMQPLASSLSAGDCLVHGLRKFFLTFIKILYMFRALPCSSSGGLRLNCIYAASGIVTLCG